VTGFAIVPDAPFDLAAAASFGFGPNTGRPLPDGAAMRMAFVADDLEHSVAVRLTQDSGGVLQVALDGDVPAAAAEAQVRRILSLDHDGPGWLAAGRRDPVLGRLQARFPGLRPVLFHSPYEAAAWAVLSQRRHRVQAAALRRRLSEAHGTTFAAASGDGDPERSAAFPTPAQLLRVQEFGGLEPTRIARLHAIATAALDGRLDPARLAAMEPDAALADLQTLPGLGPSYSTLVLLRAVGVADVLTTSEPRLPHYAAHYYERGPGPLTGDELTALAEPWRPYRTWGSVLIRVAGDRDGLPAGDPPSGRRR
jgi:DNA-3-methyladenine glycosylase II